MKKLTLTEPLSHDAAATVLAALRFWQEHRATDETPEHFASFFDESRELDAEQIDDLCEAINLQPDRPDLSLDVPAAAWNRCGSPTEDGRLLVTVCVNGTPCHLEAVPVAVTMEALDAGTTPLADDYMTEMHLAFSPDGAFQSTRIAGKNYCLFLSPFAD